jgi:hypothetical protein
MPFINGRYHINPTMGQALEAAREAEAALLALQHAARNSRDDGSDNDSDGGSAPAADSTAPVHRVEIDAAEVVPNSTRRATRGFVARVHRSCAGPSAAAPLPEPAPETHVFADHGDLLSFLRDALAQR